MRKLMMLFLVLTVIVAGCTQDTAPLSPQDKCVQEGGTWREFPNACADSCEFNRGEVTMCAQVLTMGCDCGEGQCWDGNSCIQI